MVALSIRTAVTALSPIAPHLTADIDFTSAGFGAIGTLPMAAFAVASALAPPVLRGLGLEMAMVSSVMMMTVGQVLRATAWDFTSFFIGSVLAFLGVGLGNVLLPPIVKRYFPSRISSVTAIYASALAISMVVPAVISVPLAEELGWRWLFGIWAILGVTPLLPWIVLSRSSTRDEPTDGSMGLAPLRASIFKSRSAWLVAVTLAVTSLNAFVLFTWLPDILVEQAHTSRLQAGYLLGLFAFLGVPLALIVPMIAHRFGQVGLMIRVGSALFIAGYLGLIFYPTFSPILWVTLIGLGPMLFPVCLLLVNFRSRTEAGSVALSAFMQAIGYTCACLWPTLIGIVRDATQGWVLPLWILIGTAVIGLVIARMADTSTTVEDELARRSSRLLDLGGLAGGPQTRSSRRSPPPGIRPRVLAPGRPGWPWNSS